MLSISKSSEIKSEIKQIFKFAYYSCDSQKELLDRIEGIYAKYPKSITNYERWYFKGMIELLREQFEKDNLEFCYKVGDKLYSTHKETFKDRLVDYDICYDSEAKNGFYYKHNNTPFYETWANPRNGE